MAKKKKLSKTGKAILDGIIAVALVCTGVSGYKLYTGWREYKIADEAYKDMQNTYVRYDTEETDVGLSFDWDAMKKANSQIAGWIRLENSSISYPYVYPDNNDQYLRTLLDGTWNDAGTIFIDANNSPDYSDKITVFYGHHMLNEPLMFAEIEKYKSQKYYEEHKVIHFYTPEGNFEMHPYGGFISTGTGDYVRYNFSSNEEFMEFVNGLLANSTFTGDDPIGPEDRLIMLSTCSYDLSDGRYVLIGKAVGLENLKKE